MCIILGGIYFVVAIFQKFKLYIGDIMLCANKFCIFNSFGHCNKYQIEIDDTGHCKSYIYVDISSEDLEKLKKNLSDKTIKQIMEKANL